jgi:hypothetical protein
LKDVNDLSALSLKVATSILKNDTFPKTWMNVNILAHKVLIKIIMMEPISSIMEKKFKFPSRNSSLSLTPVFGERVFTCF